MISIEGHNTSPGSSDFSLDPYVLVESASTIAVEPEPEPEPKGELRSDAAPFTNTAYSSASKQLVVMDRESGEVIWTRDAKYNFRHNNIAVAAGMVFCIDGLSQEKQDACNAAA